MAHSVLEKRKRLANVIDNEEVLFERLKCFELVSNSYITKELKNLLTNIYSTEASMLEKADEDLQNAMEVYKITTKLIKQENIRREKEKEINRKEIIESKQKIAIAKKSSKSVRELPSLMETMDISDKNS